MKLNAIDDEVDVVVGVIAIVVAIVVVGVVIVDVVFEDSLDGVSVSTREEFEPILVIEKKKTFSSFALRRQKLLIWQKSFEQSLFAFR